MCEEFKVGEKYISANGSIGTCVYSDDDYFVLKYEPSGKVISFSDISRSIFKEYKEPRSITRYAIVFEDKNGIVRIHNLSFLSKEEAQGVFTYMRNHNKLLDIIEINWTEKV